MENESHNSYSNPSPQTTRLIEVLEVLEKKISKQNSLIFTSTLQNFIQNPDTSEIVSN